MRLYGGARALLYPVQAREPFGLVLAEAMACGTPVAALDRGAVREVVDDGVTGLVFSRSRRRWSNELPRVFALDRRRVRERAVERFGVDRMVNEYVAVYRTDRGGDRARRYAPTTARSTAGRSSPCSRIPTTSRWPAAARWRGSPTPARASSCICASHGESGSISDPALVTDGDLGVRARPASCAKRLACSASPKC